MNSSTSHCRTDDLLALSTLNADVTAPSTLSRRTIIAGAAAAPGVVAALPAADAAGRQQFRHGVASGDPLPDAVVLWTRVTPTPEALPGTGKGPRVTVDWEVATDRGFRNVVRRGSVRTGAERDHTVKVDATRLSPSRWYFYRFRYRDAVSPVGRTRTAPAPTATPKNIRFGVVSCANLQAGWFNAYRALVRRDDLHAILHLGDYLYEYGPGEYGMGSDNLDVRTHRPRHEMVSLADYRRRHAQYKHDGDLRALHAKYPFIVTWDDHETANDAWAHGAENHQPGTEGDFKARTAAARRAYDEWMPVRMSGSADLHDGTRIYRRLRFGKLAELSMLDLRSYRTEQPNQLGTGDPDGTITGGKQMAWLRNGLVSRVQWKIVGNPVMIAPVDIGTLPATLADAVGQVTGGLLPPDGIAYNVDQWDGYTVDRQRVHAQIKDHSTKDVVFVTGDIHSAWACELPVDPGAYPLDSETVGVEFVCTSVTSNNLKDILGSPPHTASVPVETAIKAANRHVKHLNFDDHGFSVLDITSRRAQMDWFVTGPRDERSGDATWAVSYRTPAGSGRLERATRPVGG